MRCSTVKDRFVDLLSAPSAASYLAVRELLVQLEGYREHVSEWVDLRADFDAGRHEEVLQRASQCEEWACLSPRFHFWWGCSALEIGDPEQAVLAKERFQACLKGLIETGDGSEESPFRVTYSTDANDILRLINEIPVGQRTIETSEGRFDLIHVKGDDEPFWFDVSTFLPAVSDAFARASSLA